MGQRVLCSVWVECSVSSQLVHVAYDIAYSSVSLLTFCPWVKVQVKVNYCIGVNLWLNA